MIDEIPNYRYLEQEARRKKEKQEELLRKEEMAKKRLADVTKMKREEVLRRLVWLLWR